MAAENKENRNETHHSRFAGNIVAYAGHPASFISDPVQGQLAIDSVTERLYIYRGTTNGWEFADMATTSSSSSTSSSTSTSTSTSTTSSSTSSSSTTTP